MDDLVKRAHEMSERLRKSAVRDGFHGDAAADLLQHMADRIEADAKRIAELADEIERLRAEVNDANDFSECCNRLMRKARGDHEAAEADLVAAQERIAELERLVELHKAEADEAKRLWAEAEARVKVLEDALRERDGGRHDQDCRLLLNTGRPCNCGHVEALAALEGEKT